MHRLRENSSAGVRKLAPRAINSPIASAGSVVKTISRTRRIWDMVSVSAVGDYIFYT
ncbi:hypothetical protein D3C76_1588320 [compost metagenome]